jgi:DNA polymerase III epsilon subunit
VVLDVETTGLVPQWGDRICEIALLQFVGPQELVRFHSLVNPGRPLSPGAFAVNGITEEELADAPPFAEIAPFVGEILEGSVLVAHNAPFDLGFLDAEFRACEMSTLENPVIDTLALARRCFRLPSNRLGSLAYRLGLDSRGEHRALVDVLTTKALLERIVSDLAEQGVGTLDDLIAAQGGPIERSRTETTPLPPQIQEALNGGDRIEMRYVSAQGEETERVITPRGVTSCAGHMYLIAWCHLRNDERNFRLDRIVEMKRHRQDSDSSRDG